MRDSLWKCKNMWKTESAITVKNVKEYVWRACFVCFALPDTSSDPLKHSVWPPQTVCLTLSNMLFDNFNIYISCAQTLYFATISWQSGDYGSMRILGIFCPSDFWNDFRGHSRDTKRAKIDYTSAPLTTHADNADFARQNTIYKHKYCRKNINFARNIAHVIKNYYLCSAFSRKSPKHTYKYV